MKRHLVIVLLFALPLLLGACSGDDSSSDRTEAQAQAAVSREPAGQAAQRVSALDPEGVSHQLDQWIGQQPVVINFWGTWCPPCRREIPDLVRLYDEYRDAGVEIIGVALERSPNPGAQVKAFTEQAGMEWVQLLGNEQIARVFKYRGSVPTTIFLDSDGNEVNRHVGARTYDTFKRDFEAIAGT